MVQRLLTKYELTIHIVGLCLFPLFFIGQSRVFGFASLFWLSLIAIEWMLLLPAVRRGETLADARRRVVFAFWRDPFLYLGGAFIGLVAVQSLNSGCELIYLFDADVWKLSEPPFSWAPFSIERDAPVTQLAIFTACLVVGVVLRVSAGKAAKRVLLQILSAFSGVFALVCVGLALQGHEPWGALAAGSANAGAGIYFCFWSVLGMGLLVEVLANRRRGGSLLFLFGFLGNLLGLLCFANPLTLLLCAIILLLLLLYWIVYLNPLVPKSTQCMLLGSTLVGVSVIVAGLVLFPQTLVAKKVESIAMMAEYWGELSAQNSIRSNAAMTIWKEHSLTGIGPDGFYHMVGLAVEPEDWKVIEKDRTCVYNDGVQFLCEYGILGGGLLLTMLIVLLSPICFRLRLVWQNQIRDAEFDRTFLFRLSPIVVSGILSVMLCCFESFFASPFRSAAVLLSYVCVLASMPAFLPEQPSEETSGD